jgi:hypothetical protein
MKDKKKIGRPRKLEGDKKKVYCLRLEPKLIEKAKKIGADKHRELIESYES